MKKKEKLLEDALSKRLRAFVALVKIRCNTTNNNTKMAICVLL